jgi:hypothetical protein
MSTFLGYKPCLEEMTHSSDPNAVFYPLEREQHSNCAADETTKTTYDTRYKPLGYEVSEYQVQLDSGVLSRLNSLPLFQQYVP